MVFKSIISTTCACLACSCSFNADATLVFRLGGQAYYDTEADLTWLADANAAGTVMNWATANDWAADLDVSGVTGWRLPTSQADLGCGQVDNCIASEMSNLFYNVLGGVKGSSIRTTHNANFDLFSKVQSANYWSSTVNEFNVGQPWGFNMNGGFRTSHSDATGAYAWAVHSGDIAPAPIPASVWLFGSGLIGLIGVARRKKA